MREYLSVVREEGVEAKQKLVVTLGKVEELKEGLETRVKMLRMHKFQGKRVVRYTKAP